MRIKLKFKKKCVKQDKVTFYPKNVVNLFIAQESHRWPQDFSADFILKNCLFGSVKLTKIADPDKYFIHDML